MADDNVVKLEIVSVGESYVISPDKILENAKGKYQRIVVVGISEEEGISVMGSHDSNEAFMLLHLGADHLLGMKRG